MFFKPFSSILNVKEFLRRFLECGDTDELGGLLKIHIDTNLLRKLAVDVQELGDLLVQTVADFADLVDLVEIRDI